MSVNGMKARHKVVITLALGAMVLVPAAQAVGSSGRQNPNLVGTWQVTVDPGAPGGGDAFESTLSYSDSRQVMESTSRATATTEGLGAWQQVDRTTYRMTFQKYRFGGDVYVGKAVIRETITLVDGDTYRGEATTTIFDAAGNTMAVIPSQTVASRMIP
jgi:hypothetical protein